MARILIIEDHYSVRMALYRSLTRLGHECVAITDGGEILDQIDPSQFDIVLLDITLQKFHGDDALGFLHFRPRINEEGQEEIEICPPPPVILITGQPELRRVQWLMQFPAVKALIMKPFRIEQVEEEIQKVVSISRPAAAALA